MNTLKSIISWFLYRHRLTPNELTEVQELNRIVAAEKWKATVIKGNTARVDHGQDVARQLEQVAATLETRKDELINAKLGKMGYPANQPVSIDLKTGKITKVNESPNTRQAE